MMSALDFRSEGRWRIVLIIIIIIIIIRIIRIMIIIIIIIIISPSYETEIMEEAIALVEQKFPSG